MKKNFAVVIISCLIQGTAIAQGCIIVRNISGFGQYNLTDHAFSTSDWYLNITNRYFKSFRDYKGTEHLKFPKDSIQTIHSFTTDFTISRLLQGGWSLSLSIPVSVNSRISKLEHGGISNPAHATRSFGLGDVRFTAYKWLLAPKANQKGNIQFGLGIKFATGDYKYEDYFYRKEDSEVLAPVNPSIQLGDGGTGIIAETNMFYIPGRRISFYGNFYYLLNPRDHNGTSNLLGRDPSSPSLINLVKAQGAINSVPDQYSLRAGGHVKFHDVLFSLGFRDEGIPVYDLLGKNNGNRRAGHNWSFEPGIIYTKGASSVYVYVPVVVATEIKQSVPDKRESAYTGKFILRQGNATRYFLLAGVQVRL